MPGFEAKSEMEKILADYTQESRTRNVAAEKPKEVMIGATLEFARRVESVIEPTLRDVADVIRKTNHAVLIQNGVSQDPDDEDNAIAFKLRLTDNAASGELRFAKPAAEPEMSIVATCDVAGGPQESERLALDTLGREAVAESVLKLVRMVVAQAQAQRG